LREWSPLQRTTPRVATPLDNAAPPDKPAPLDNAAPAKNAAPPFERRCGYGHSVSQTPDTPAPAVKADTALVGIIRVIARIALGAFLLVAGIAHLTVSRSAFQAQVPEWLPLDKDFVVVASGIVEIALGIALIVLGRYRVAVGWIVALFFLAIFPGNISQFVTHTDSFGLNTDLARGIRLLFQPLLVVWALWSTGAWRAWRARSAIATSQKGR
jgi:uncharacterized membrane protein